MITYNSFSISTNLYSNVARYYKDMLIVGILEGVNKEGRWEAVNYKINNNFKETIHYLVYKGFTSVRLHIRGAKFQEVKPDYLITELLTHKSL